jgi:hypothetical protein
MNLTVTVQPPFEPVTLAQAYSQLNLDADPYGDSPTGRDDDGKINGFIMSARIDAERQAQRSFVQRSLRLTTTPNALISFDRAWFVEPWTHREHTLRCGPDWIELPRPPLVYVAAVSYYDTDNALTVLDPSNYYVADAYIPQLRLARGCSLPSMYDRPDALVIDYIAGYAPTASPSETQDDYAANVPQNYKDGILLGVQILYDNPMGPMMDALVAARDNLLSVDAVPTLA